MWKEQRYETKLPGRHQVSNAVTALAASEYLFRKDYEKNNARKAIAKKLDEMNGCLLYTSIEAVIGCERESHKRIIIGKKGSMIKEIGTQAREEMENLLDTKVNLKLWVKVRKDWRDSDILLKNYGYNKKEL